MLGGPKGVVAAKVLGQVAATSRAAWTLPSKHAEGNEPLPGHAGPDMVRAVLCAAAPPQPVVGWQPVVCIPDDLDRAPAAHD
jgi:hypothetical protein